MKKPIGNKKLQVLYLETGMEKVIQILFRYPEREFSLSDLAKEAGIAKANIGSILYHLQTFGFVKIEKLTKIWRIKADQESPEFIREKLVHNLGILYRSCLVDFLVDHYKNPKAIILFGSFRNGEDISTSDIDIAIETDTDDYKTEELKHLSEYEKLLHRKIQIHLFSRKHANINVFNNIVNGIVLWGFLEAKP